MDQTVDVVDCLAKTHGKISSHLRDGLVVRMLYRPVVDLLESVTLRMLERGLDRHAISQVLFSTWHGRRQIVELLVFADEAIADQIKRMILWALMELFNLVKDPDNTPTVAWMIMQTVIDVHSSVGIS